MKKPVDRAAVRRVIRETLFLRRLVEKRLDGSPIPGKAFGLDLTNSVPALSAKEYLFSITVDPLGLELEIDVYSATHPEWKTSTDFDVDAWEAGKLRLVAAPLRTNYQTLQRVARACLSGFDVYCPETGAFLAAGVRRAEGLPC